MNEYLVITWADSVPAGDGLADAHETEMVNCSPPGRYTTQVNWTRVRPRPVW